VSERVSVVVPVFNGARYLAECLRSVLDQTHAAAELIVVDDGSTDATPQVARQFGSAVTYLRQEKGGHGSARNRGVARATGDFLAFVDADDLFAPSKTEAQLARFRARPGLQFCDGFCRNFWSPEIAEAERWPQPRMRFTHRDDPRAHSIITWLMRRELFSRIGPFDERQTFGEDADWFDRMLEADTPCDTVPQVLARRRLHRDNLTLTRYDEYLRALVRRNRRRIVAARRRA
jgi:glycosyltransferase involved in cell wall biosynthesis